MIPLVNVFNFHYAYGGPLNKLKVGFVNDEISLRECNYTVYEGCFFFNEHFYLSCIFADLLRNRTYEVKEYHDEASAIRAVKENEVWASLHFVKNYTQLFAQYLAGINTKTVVDDVKINIWVDLSSHFVGVLVRSEVVEYSKVHRQIALKQCGFPSKSIGYPGVISFQPPLNVAGDLDSGAVNSVVPSLLVLSTICLASLSTAMVGTEEKLNGTICRMQAGGLSLYEFLISMVVVQVFMQIIRTFAFLTMLYWLLGYTHRGDLIVAIFLLMLLGFLGMLFGILSTVMTSNPTVTMISQNAFTYVVSFTSGLMWPVEGQQTVLRFINNFFPFTWSASAAQGILLRDMSFTNKTVLEGFGVTIVWLIISVLTVGCILKYRPGAIVTKG